MLITLRSSPASWTMPGSRKNLEVGARLPPRYDEFMARHPKAFADHAGEFWLGIGTDPDKTLWLAQMNLEVRKTPLAYDLLSKAVSAKKAARSLGEN